MSRTFRWSATVLILACLTAGTAQAWPFAQSRPDLAASEVGSRLVAACDWFLSLVLRTDPKPEPAAPSSTSRQKGGCGMDPDGKPLPCY